MDGWTLRLPSLGRSRPRNCNFKNSQLKDYPTVFHLTFVYLEAKFQQKADEQYNDNGRQYMYVLSNSSHKQQIYHAQISKDM